jgi:cytochrome c oxidase subunit IV
MADATPVPPVSADMAQELQVESHAPYIKVWAGLAILTAVEYFYALLFKDYFILLVAGLLSLAIVKAGMVGWYFMHLKFEKPWVYILIVPALAMAFFLTTALLPDQAFRPTDDEEGEENQSWTVPAPEFPTETPIRLVSNVQPDCTRELPAGLS